jgi:geranylgeranyl diphosphate synthase type II
VRQQRKRTAISVRRKHRIAFQLQDDILDVYGDPEKFGKQVGGDIIANKKTLLLLKLKELAGDSDLQELEKQSVSQDFEDKISNTTLLYNKYNIRELATTEMRNYSEKAFNALSALAVPEERKRELILLSNQLMNREH